MYESWIKFSIKYLFKISKTSTKHSAQNESIKYLKYTAFHDIWYTHKTIFHRDSISLIVL